MRIIGLTGAAGAGKDTVAEMVASHDSGTGGVAVRQGFADSLKLSAARIVNPAIDQNKAVEFCNWLKTDGRVQFVTEDGPAPALQSKGGEVISDISGRQFLQRYGTEAHRDVFGQDFWLNAVLPEGRDDCDTLLIPDVRFENEAQRIKDRGGEVWKVIRPGIEAVEAHSSESGISSDLIDFYVINDGGLDDLTETVRKTLG